LQPLELPLQLLELTRESRPAEQVQIAKAREAFA
jgi:hypothetical protein